MAVALLMVILVLCALVMCDLGFGETWFVGISPFFWIYNCRAGLFGNATSSYIHCVVVTVLYIARVLVAPLNNRVPTSV